MLSINEIKELINMLDESSLNEFIYEANGEKLKLKKQTDQLNRQNITASQKTQEVEMNQGLTHDPVSTQNNAHVEKETSGYDHKITSPMVGTFYFSSSPESEPYVSIGDQITKQTVVCMIEAMKLFNEIEAEINGEIVEIFVENGELVEYGQPLFGVKQK